MKSKLRKMLGDEVNNGFTSYLNGELKRTTDEVAEYASQFDECDIECIRAQKVELQLEMYLIEHPDVKATIPSD